MLKCSESPQPAGCCCHYCAAANVTSISSSRLARCCRGGHWRWTSSLEESVNWGNRRTTKVRGQTKTWCSTTGKSNRHSLEPHVSGTPPVRCGWRVTLGALPHFKLLVWVQMNLIPCAPGRVQQHQCLMRVVASNEQITQYSLFLKSNLLFYTFTDYSPMR